ncbi:MAG: RNA 2',3'-cyclic phosphodiesterase [Atopobiaceae bacterium]|nr:RNA 2',3'-cyclic phosphodiesterase [Atopobiaceae bacterium]
MRLFVALELPEELLDALSETSAALRDSVRGRYVAPDRFHVTLAFLGEVAGTRVGSASSAVAQACAGHGPLPVALGELGSFGRRNSAVLWQGVEGGELLDALARDVRASLKDAGFSLDDKSFLPHVTLMRAADLTKGALPMPALARGVVDTVTLFSSDLSGAHPVYTPLERFFLG